jgi:hypothetical protein
MCCHSGSVLLTHLSNSLSDLACVIRGLDQGKSTGVFQLLLFCEFMKMYILLIFLFFFLIDCMNSMWKMLMK